jgi:8-oxoguanine deaminase
MRSLDFAGGMHDPLASLVFCTPARVSWSVINGRLVVREGRLTALDVPRHVERHNTLALRLVRGE